jgi:hypothetical protein
MKNFKKELLSISKTISELATKVETLAQELTRGDAKKAPVKKATAPKKNKKAKAKKVVKKPYAKKATASSTGILDTIYGIISRSRKGITVAQLRAKTDLEVRQVNNAIYKLKQKGKIEAVSRGVYMKKKG